MQDSMQGSMQAGISMQAGRHRDESRRYGQGQASSGREALLGGGEAG